MMFGITEPTWPVMGKKQQTNNWLTNPNRNFNETNEPQGQL